MAAGGNAAFGGLQVKVYLDPASIRSRRAQGGRENRKT